MYNAHGGAKNKMAHDSKQVAQYILWLAREKPITPMQLLKLTYLSHGWMLGLYGKPLLRESVEAWQYGPVIPTVYHTYKRFGGRSITDIPLQEPAGFTDEERDVMQQVWNIYGKYDGIQLSSLTHKPGTPWAITRQMCGNGAQIPNDLIQNHYRALAPPA
jgi:uncharacterized phage-associated protein